MCKKLFTCFELWFDEVYEIITVEVKCREPKITWKFVGIYRDPNEDMRLI